MDYKRLLLSFFPLLYSLHIVSIPAYPKKVRLSSGVYITIRGDEHCKWGISESGYTILPTERGWMYARDDGNGYAVASEYELVSEEEENEELTAFLKGMQKGLPLDVASARNETKHIMKAERQASESGEKHAAVGNRKALVIMMSFANLGFKKRKADFDDLFNKENYNEDGAIGSVRDFFSWASYGKLHFTCDVVGPFTAQHEMAYYGGNLGSSGGDRNPYALFEEAVSNAVNEVNLRDYDSDGDGYVDNIHIIFAGYGEEAGAASSAIWSHEMTFQTITVQGMKINKYSCAPELRGNSGSGISRIGPHCHEMGHALGAMDYYDVDYKENGEYPGTGQWDVMASGSWNNDGISPADFNPYVKVYNFGWAEAQELAAECKAEIRPAYEDDAQIYRIDTTVSGEFFLLENRQQERFDSALPGNGLLIFHIGPNIESWAVSNTINSKYPQQCYVVCASSNYKTPSADASSYGNTNSDGCPFPGTSDNTSFADDTSPSALCIDGTKSGVTLTDISLCDGVVTLYNGAFSQPSALEEILWIERFEYDDWTCRWTQDKDSWKIYTDNIASDKRPIGEPPVAVDGDRYLYVSVRGFSIGGSSGNTYEIASLPLSIGEMENCKLRFSYYNSPEFNSLSSYTNLLSVYMETDGVRKLLESFDGTNQGWIDVEIDLPNVSSKEFCLVLKAEGNSSGIVCVDNLLIIRKTDKTAIKDVENFPAVEIVDGGIVVKPQHKAQFVCIFDFKGRLIRKERVAYNCNTLMRLSKGYYMLSVDGKSVKIVL
ncbi:MAG: M6 family metalloprotease domain-containing protein [Bacteroides sp.]|nr:M6 family metalloprotease domain-containing protein [Roseburia sp.]MCM1346633.1 M6 family metalloprotease domain-containing protein [Bacteroides sp.]MCM1420040.1 M6 family metalloprotease domain-containing protein [Bacteroides sp.]